MGSAKGWSGDGLWLGGGIMFRGSMSLVLASVAVAFPAFIGHSEGGSGAAVFWCIGHSDG